MATGHVARHAVLACGEVRTCLLPTQEALDARAAVQLFELRSDECVLTSERPNLYTRSPRRLTGVDCPLPNADGAKIRAVGTVSSRGVLTGGRVLQSSAYFRVLPAGPSQRQPWIHYLMRPGVVEPVGKLPRETVAQGVVDGGRPGELDMGVVAGALLTRFFRSTLLDHRVPFRSRATRLRWTALLDEDRTTPVIERFVLVREDLRTVQLRLPQHITSDQISGLCEDLALHDWLLTTLVDRLDGIRLGGTEGTTMIRMLRPAVDHLLHLWMPRARVSQELASLWDELEETPGFTRQWQTLVQRIRDQLSLQAIRLAWGNFEAP